MHRLTRVVAKRQYGTDKLVEACKNGMPILAVSQRCSYANAFRRSSKSKLHRSQRLVRTSDRRFMMLCGILLCKSGAAKLCESHSAAAHPVVAGVDWAGAER